MKGKTELLTNFKWILKISIPTVEMLQKEIQNLYNLFFLKIIKLSSQTRFKVFFQNDMPSMPVKHHFAYLLLH
jgi:hypothetical protein